MPAHPISGSPEIGTLVRMSAIADMRLGIQYSEHLR
jgi:hypothetical protein